MYEPKNISIKKCAQIVLIVILFLGFSTAGGSFVDASETDGTIDSTNRYGWSENTGWIDFGSSGGAVHVVDSALTGYVYGENIGWISLNCSNDSSCGTTNYAVVNNSEGDLSGYAWSENTGWVDFENVAIDSSGIFSGYAYGENIGNIVFGNTSNKVVTDWRPVSSRSVEPPEPEPEEGGDGGSRGSSGGRKRSVSPELPDTNTVQNATAILTSIIPGKISGTLDSLTSNFFGLLKPEPEPTPVAVKPIEESVPQDAQFVFRGGVALSDNRLQRFLFDPLPENLSSLALNFPEVGSIFSLVGVNKIGDIQKLADVRIHAPTFGRLPDKKNVPPDTIFARSTGGKIDVDIVLSLTDSGDVRSTLKTVTGQELTLAIKPSKKAKSVEGRVLLYPESVFSKADTKPSSFLASALSAIKFARAPSASNARLDQTIVDTFTYQDSEGDGIYEGSLTLSGVSGRYRIQTTVVHADGSTPKEISLVTVVDPQGYVYRKAGSDEARVGDAEVSLYSKNLETGEFELWDATSFLQDNPQLTDKSGSYSFLVPKGEYYLQVTADGYTEKTGEVFEVRVGGSVSENIELERRGFWSRLLVIFK